MIGSAGAEPTPSEGTTAADVVQVIDRIESVGACYQINGGWAVDALVGRQTRAHGDLDVFIDAEAVHGLISWLQEQGYTDEVDELPARLQLRRGRSRIDVHPMTLDGEQNGTQWDGTGRGIYAHPHRHRTTGRIAGRLVVVATAARLRELHIGYRLRDIDEHDLQLLTQL